MDLKIFKCLFHYDSFPNFSSYSIPFYTFVAFFFFSTNSCNNFATEEYGDIIPVSKQENADTKKKLPVPIWMSELQDCGDALSLFPSQCFCLPGIFHER